MFYTEAVSIITASEANGEETSTSIDETYSFLVKNHSNNNILDVRYKPTKFSQCFRI